MKKNKKLNRKAFTLIELLGVIVIIGILSVVSIVAVSRYFNKSRDQIDEQNKNNVKIAAESYFQANRDLLPKGIGEFATVDLKDLRKANYLTSDVSNSKDESCMEESYVRVVKLDNEHYSYLVNLYCGDETRADVSETVPEPYLVKFEFHGKDKQESGAAFNDVKNASFSFTIRGHETDKNIGIYSYQYMISVKGNDGSDEYHTVFDSGSIKANSKYEVSVDSEKISKYIDITGQVQVKVDIAVMNDQGGYLNYSSDDGVSGVTSQYEDIQPPVCGKVSGDTASDDEWTNKATYSSGTTNLGRTRGYPSVVTVKCDDGLGSGCKRPDFSKSWPTVVKNELGKVDYRYGARWAYVVLEDNAVNTSIKSKDCTESGLMVDSKTNEVKSCSGGNKTVCYVRVNVDIYSPTVNLKVYNPKNGEVVKEITAADKKDPNTTYPEKTINAGDYKGVVGVDKEEWLNLANFPEGIELSFDAEDQLYLYHWTWQTNDAYLPYASADSDITNSDIVNEENARLDGTVTTSGYFDKEGLITGTGKVTNPEELKANETGPLTGSAKGLKLKLEGKRYGKLTVYDRAGNSTTIHVYANIDRTPPEIPTMTHKKNGAETVKAKYTADSVTTEKLTYKATGEKYEPATKDNFTDNYHWSRETLSTYVDGQREDNKGTASKVYDVNIRGNGDLSGWWKFTYVYEMQDPYKKKYSWKDAVEKDATETLTFKDEGTHKVRIRSCDKAKNCSEYSPDDYLKIDYTLPSCDIKEDFTGVRGCSTATTCFNSNCKSSSSTCYNKNGWLKIGESVILSHVCNDPNSNISSDCNASSKFNQQKYEYNFDVDTAKAGANGFENSKSGKSLTGTYINSEDFRDEWYNPGTMTAGGHVVDYAGNIQECPVKEVKIDYIAPKCETKIEYGKDGVIDSSVYPKNPSTESGWLSLYNGGFVPGSKDTESYAKETATVSTVCTDPTSNGPRMINVLSDCDPDSAKSTVYNWELRTTIAGALGIGQGGDVSDMAGNITPCPADRSVNIDYTRAKCNTIIEYPQGSPINQNGVDIESGWLGYSDNVNCLNGKVDYSYRYSGTASAVTGSTNKTGVSSGTPATSSNIKGEGNVKTVEHKPYLSAGVNGNSTVTRAEYAKILCDALGVSPTNTNNNLYKDVNESTPNWGYILAASQQGFFVGVGGGNFSPNTILSRAELASSIIRAAAARGVTSSQSCSIQFVDTAGTWYDNDMRAASNSCILVGIGGSQAAGSADATIAQIATVIYRTFREADESGCKSSDNKTFDVSSNTSYSPSWASAALADATTKHVCTNGVEASGIVQSDGSMEFDAYIDSNAYDYTAGMKRQEFLKLVYDSAQVKPSASYKGKFTDVPKSNNYWPYIEDAAQKGYISGVGNNKFAPSNSITRAEMVTVLVRIMEDNGLSTGKTCSTSIPDLAKGQWYTPYMEKAAGMCLLVGDQNGYYYPTEYATNMEAIAVVYRAFRDHDGLDCKTADGTDYDDVMLEMNGVSEDFWGYEYLKDASIPHTCSGTLIDPATQNNTKSNIPDTSCDQRVDVEKTAIITQICTEQSGQNGIMSGCYGSLKDLSSIVETSYQTKTYDFEVNTTQGGAVDVGNNGFIIDVAGNKTNCSTPENWHTVKIDYTRPTCDITAKYNDMRTGKSGDYRTDVHFMGKSSSVTIRSFCASDGGGSNCWEEKNSTFTYASEIKTDHGTSKPDLATAYIYDLAGNMSEACPDNPVQIDHTGPVCKTEAKYFKNSEKVADSSNMNLGQEYDAGQNLVPNWATGWLNGDYTVRVISYCEKDEVNNVIQASDSSGAGCKDYKKTDPSTKKNQRSTNDYTVYRTNKIINEAKGARGAQNKTTDNNEFYEHKAYSISGGVTRLEFAQTLLNVVGIDVDNSATHPFTDVSGNAVVGTVYQYGLMIGTSGTTFSPNTQLTRAQMIVATVRAAKAMGISHTASCTKASFTDYTRGSNVWYASDVDYAIDNCILVGFGDTQLRPEDVTTPDQVYAVMDRALRPHQDGYKCTPDVISQRKDSPWTNNGTVERVYHKCVREEAANSDGAKHVIYDDVGNKTECEDVLIKLDDEKPKCEIKPSGYVTQANNRYWSKTETITVTKICTDGGSQCSDNATLTENACNKPNATETYKPDYVDSKGDSPGAGHVENKQGNVCKSSNNSGFVVDGVGNKTTCTSPAIGFDQQNPTCTYNAPYDNVWINNGWNVTAYCSDSSTGCRVGSQYSSIPRREQYEQETFKWNFTDNVNNTAVCQKTVTKKIDLTKPTVSCTAGYGYNDYNIWLNLSPSFSDSGGSGLSSTSSSMYNGASLSCSSSYTITVYAYDVAGNYNYNTCSTGTTRACCDSIYRSCGSCSWGSWSCGPCGGGSCGTGSKSCLRSGSSSCGYYSNYNGRYCSSAGYDSCSDSTTQNCSLGPCSTGTGFILRGFNY